MPVVRVAPAKLNLTLAVLGRRPDGYHDLHSVMVPLALADLLSLAPAASGADRLHVSGSDLSAGPDNLVLRAVAALRARLGRAGETLPPLAIRLEKRIPLAAGLGGGSSDAAAAIDGALEAWGLDLDPDTRAGVAAAVGSDVPFFLAGGPALVSGRGETVHPLRSPSGPPLGVLLVAPASRSRLQPSTLPSRPARDRPGSPRSTSPASSPRASHRRRSTTGRASSRRPTTSRRRPRRSRPTSSRSGAASSGSSAAPSASRAPVRPSGSSILRPRTRKRRLRPLAERSTTAPCRWPGDATPRAIATTFAAPAAQPSTEEGPE